MDQRNNADFAAAKRFGAELMNWAVRLMILGSFVFIWRMYEAQQRFIETQLKTDGRVTQVERELTFRLVQLERDMARIEGNMVTIDTLKRMELYIDLITERLGLAGRIDLGSRKIPPIVKETP